MLAFHNDPELKNRTLFRVAAHPELFVRFIENRPRDIYRKKLHIEYLAPALQKNLGLPIDLTHLMHAILQNLPRRHVNIFRDQLLAAITPGVDLSRTSATFIHWLLTDPDGPRKGLSDDDLSYLDCDAELYERYFRGESVDWEPTILGADLAIWWAEEERVSTELYYFARYAAQAPHSSYATEQTAIRAARLTSPDYWGKMNYKLTQFLLETS
jgi:hypothetical protein